MDEGLILRGYVVCSWCRECIRDTADGIRIRLGPRGY
jgi:hypothetical protein